MGCAASKHPGHAGGGETADLKSVSPPSTTPGGTRRGSRLQGSISPAGRSLALADSSGPSRPASPALSVHTGGSQQSLPADYESAPELAADSEVDESFARYDDAPEPLPRDAVEVESLGGSDAHYSGLVHMTDVGSAAGEAIPTPPPPTQDYAPVPRQHWAQALIFAEDRETQSILLSRDRQEKVISAWRSDCKLPLFKDSNPLVAGQPSDVDAFEDWRWDLNQESLSSSTESAANYPSIVSATNYDADDR